MFAKLVVSLFLLPAGALSPTLPATPHIQGDAVAFFLQRADTGEILDSKNSTEPLPIASLTKLMTAIVFLESGISFDQTAEVLPEDDRIGGKLYIFSGEEVTVRDLFYSSLVGSANNATVALVRMTKDSRETFVRKMNDKARALGLSSMRFEEPTGLSPKNVGSAEDVARLLLEAKKFPEIQKAIQTREYRFETRNTKQAHRIKSTNELWESFLTQPPYTLGGGKTGYLDEAGYCFAISATKGDRELVGVVLGAKNEAERFSLAKRLLYWGLEKF